jgi:hypothetical protein
MRFTTIPLSKYFLQLIVYSEDYRDELGEDFLLTSDWDVLNRWHGLPAIWGNDAISAKLSGFWRTQRYC